MKPVIAVFLNSPLLDNVCFSFSVQEYLFFSRKKEKEKKKFIFLMEKVSEMCTVLPQKQLEDKLRKTQGIYTYGRVVVLWTGLLLCLL